MTSPTPLTSPAGIVFAYACGECRRVANGGNIWTPRYADEDVLYISSESLEEAEACCRCERCEKLASRDQTGWPGLCDACRPAQALEER